MAYRLSLLGAQNRVDGVGVNQEQAFSWMAKRVECTRLDQRLGDLLVAGPDFDFVQVVRKVGELALIAAGVDQRTHHVGADVAHRAQAVADVGTHR